MRPAAVFFFLCVVLSLANVTSADDGNRLAYLDGPCDPYYPGRTSPKLVTPQWVGEPDVEAVIVLAIDDLSDTTKYETFLRPILDQLKQIDGRAPVSLMTNQVDPKDPQLQRWLKEGLSLEAHTSRHRCPCLQGGDLATVKQSYDSNLDLMASIPNNRPVGFRMPCCDSMSSVSPRYFTEVMFKTTPGGHFVTMDSSVFLLFTADDPALPRELVLEPDGRERFRKYVPTDRVMVNLIEDYPYPYTIGNRIWEIPPVMPSDWDAQHLHGTCNDKTVADLKAAVDAVVIKQGIFSICFHPHNWIRNDQIIEVIDHAVKKHGKKVKFLTFREVQDRLDANFLGGRPLRAKDGRDNGIRVLDADGDGHMDAVTAEEKARLVGRKLPYPLPDGTASLAAGGTAMFDIEGRDAGLRFVDVDEDGHLDVVFSNAERYSIHLFTSMEKGWSRCVLSGKRGEKPAKDELPMIVRADGTNNGAWFKDRHLWVQNEDTGGKLPGHVDSRWFTKLLAAETDPPMRSPEQSLRAMKVRPGFRVELAVAEPLVRDPIDIAWGPDGKAWVVEMADYPMGMSPDGHLGPPEEIGVPGGRVRFLEDTDGDGQYDKSTVFLDPIGWPAGVMPWREGVIVVAAPEVFYAEDTDGDGKADLRRTLFAGFGQGNQQHRVNHPRWGLDNWVHLANGDSNGQIRSAKTGQVVDVGGRDLRIRPDSGELDTQSGRAQYGRNRDDWGNWFGCNNPNPGWHYALADHYIRRNRHVAAPAPRVDLTSQRDSYPIGRVITHCFYEQPTPPEGQPGIWTCICSTMIYRDDLFGPLFTGNLFVSDSVYNVVHRMVVKPHGVTFRGERAVGEERSEFLASADPWFRPATIRTGPDGALWVCDMYRPVIEHPEWIDERLIDKLDLREGHALGRIYRIVPVGSKPRPIPRLDKLDTAGLIAALDSPSGWQRDMAQQMLLWRGDKAAVPMLQKTAVEAKRPLARLHALCTLESLKAVGKETVRRALADVHPGVRRHAVRLSEPLLNSNPAVGEMLVKLAFDADAQVRMQVAYSLGEWNDPRASRALGELAVAADGDPLLTAAVMSSATHDLDRMVAAILDDPEKAPQRAELIGKLVAMAVAMGDTKSVAAMLETVGAKPQAAYGNWQYALTARILDDLARQRTSLAKLVAGGGTEMDRSAGRLAGLFAAARRTTSNVQATVADRVAAMQVLGRTVDRREEDLAVLAGQLVPQTPMELQLAAVETLGRLNGSQIPELLLQGWSQQGPKVHGAIFDVLLRREPWTVALLDAIENRPNLAVAIGTTQRDLLVRHRSEPIRRRAETLFGKPTTKAQIDDALKKFQGVAKMKGDVPRGKKMFTEATCADCHKLEDVGKHVGPDLRTLVDKSADALLVATIDPNRALEDRFVEYTAITTDGLQINGLLLEETGNSVTLADVKGESHVILRKDLEELVSNNRSHMPESLDAKLDLQQMADLIAFIAQTGPPCKEFPGNRPEIVRAGANGSVELPAAKAAIYGPNLIFESKYRNLGWWSAAEDHAVWTFELPRGGVYDVWLDWACQSGEAGKTFRLQVGEQTITGTVPPSGTWDRYMQRVFGRIVLTPGEHRLIVRSAGPISGPLIDLRSVSLLPTEPTEASPLDRR
ncbi:MAG: c-type cytochrome [Candidatus Nealsonbacteria bacterium]|nr:c-type cytochrome [Candidatus Nealsonbacteria bacterium]